MQRFTLIALALVGPSRYEVVWFDSMENVRLHVQKYVEKRPRWWIDGKLVAAPELKRIRAKTRFVEEVMIRFGLPNFLGVLKPGDRVAILLPHPPAGNEPLIAIRVQQLMRMPGRERLRPVLTNRKESELMAARLAKRNTAAAPTTGPAGP
jgi:hypothetical protein